MDQISKYNFFQERDDGSLLAYNATSGALAVMTAENFKVYKSIEQKIQNSSNPVYDSQEQELLKQLKYASFIYTGDYKELDRLYYLHHASRFDDSSLGFVMAPTMACNMDCEYCFASNKKGRMDVSTIEAILSHIEKCKGKTEEVGVTWYGGEPLLAMDIIEDITESILDMGQELDFKYSAYTITNGYLLDKGTVDKLAALKVTGAQITLDGPAHLHDKKRPLKNGRSSFETIVENMKYASTKMNITVRVNIDKNFNNEVIMQMLDELEAADLKDSVNLYFGLIEPLSSACANITDNCFKIEEYSRIETDFFRILFDRGFKVEKLPSPMSNHCMTQSISGFILDHEGYMYRCFNHIGDRARAMGKIHDDINYLNNNFLNLFGFDPFAVTQCRECNILPICMGGCPSRRREQDISDEDLCASWKHNLPNMLELIALSRQQQMQVAQKE